jgi:hypothetical protein
MDDYLTKPATRADLGAVASALAALTLHENHALGLPSPAGRWAESGRSQVTAIGPDAACCTLSANADVLPKPARAPHASVHNRA